jgi:hypothetical protein
MATNRKKFFKLHGIPEESSISMEDVATLADMPIQALQEVYNRGIGAWKTNPTSVRLKGTFEKKANAPRQSRISKEAWANARVYAFVMKTPKVYYGADNDIREHFGLK